MMQRVYCKSRNDTPGFPAPNPHRPAALLTPAFVTQRSYTDKIGVESADLFNEERTDWIRRRFETPGIQSLTKEEKRILMARLIRSTK